MKRKFKLKTFVRLLVLYLLFPVLIISGCGGGGSEEKSKVGSLSINTSPSGAVVYLDGEQKGTSPFNLDGISAGSHKIKAAKPLYDDTEQNVVVEENKTVTITITLSVSTQSVSTSLPNDGGQPPF